MAGVVILPGCCALRPSEFVNIQSLRAAVLAGAGPVFWVDRVEALGYQGPNSSKLSTKGEVDVVFKGLMAAVTAASLVVSPTVAMAQQSGIVSTAASAQATPAAETLEGESDLMQRDRRKRRGFIIPLFAITLVILAILIIFDDNDGPPNSP